MKVDDQKFKQLIGSVGDSLGKLGELELSYKKSKDKLTGELTSYVKQLAVLSDSQAIRAKVIRELYWNVGVSVTVLKEAFGLSQHRIVKLAGTQSLDFPCKRNCGNTITKIVTSKYDLANTVGRIESSSFHYVCDDCERRDKLKAEQESINRKKAFRLRNDALYQMSWEDFTETPEWKYIRNAAVCDADYCCERCNTQPENLYVFPHKDTPQSRINAYSDAIYRHYVLCSKCIGNYEELINSEKRDIVKKEFLPIIKEWAYKNQYGWDRF